MSDLFERADPLLEAALDLLPTEREPFLDRACAGEPELRALLDRLLAAALGEGDGDGERLTPGGALGTGGRWGAELERELARREAPPNRVGRYRLLRELGRGGMAVVYLAERADGDFAQQVAIKLLQRGRDGDEMLGRFEQERQILAAASHPGIARLLDGGVLPDGRPYLVMEHVAGRPIDRYADEERLSVAERLRLFLQIGRAVEDAHRNLVIHRDLKPSNILVTDDGHAKLLDFGIAKLLDPLTPGEAAATRTVARLLTPAYASPEQIAGAPVTTASDVYQLGLLLFVLLSGRFPYRLADTHAAEAARIVTTEEPARLTAAPPGRMEETAEEVARARQTTPARLLRELAGDLETIVAMALRKEPERRYGSVAALLSDLENHLEGRTVSARADTVTYRVSRLVRRHRTAVATAAVGLALLAASAVAYGIRLRQERDRAERAAARATQTATFLRGLFAVSAPTRSLGERVTARQLLDQGAARAERELARQPELAADLMTLMGEVYGELAYYDEARPLLERAVALRRRLPGERRPDLADSLEALARVRADGAAPREAKALYREALALHLQMTGPEGAAVGRDLDGLGRVLALEGRYAAAALFHRRGLALLEAALGPADPEVGLALRNLGAALRMRNENGRARPLLERAIAVLAARYGPDHPWVAEARVQLGVALWGLHDPAAARAEIERALPVLERTHGPDHPLVATALGVLGAILSFLGEPARAIPLLERSLAIRQQALGPSHPEVGLAYATLGRAESLAGSPAASLPALEHARAILEQTLGPDHPEIANLDELTASILTQLGRPREALSLTARALAIRERTLGADNLFLIFPLYSLGNRQMELGDLAAAERTLRRVLALGRGRISPLSHMLAMPQIDLARCLMLDRRTAEAEALLRPLTVEEAEPEVRRQAAKLLASVLERQGKAREAERYRDLFRRQPPAPGWRKAGEPTPVNAP